MQTSDSTILIVLIRAIQLAHTFNRQALANARAAMQRRQEQLQGRAHSMGISWDADDDDLCASASAAALDMFPSEGSSVASACSAPRPSNPLPTEPARETGAKLPHKPAAELI